MPWPTSPHRAPLAGPVDIDGGVRVFCSAGIRTGLCLVRRRPLARAMQCGHAVPTAGASGQLRRDAAQRQRLATSRESLARTRQTPASHGRVVAWRKPVVATAPRPRRLRPGGPSGPRRPAPHRTRTPPSESCPTLFARRRIPVRINLPSSIVPEGRRLDDGTNGPAKQTHLARYAPCQYSTVAKPPCFSGCARVGRYGSLPWILATRAGTPRKCRSDRRERDGDTG